MMERQQRELERQQRELQRTPDDREREKLKTPDTVPAPVDKREDQPSSILRQERDLGSDISGGNNSQV